MAIRLTGGQRKFLKAVAEKRHAVFHVRVTGPLFKAGLVFPVHGALFPWIVGCNGQLATDYFLTETGVAALRGLDPAAPVLVEERTGQIALWSADTLHRAFDQVAA